MHKNTRSHKGDDRRMKIWTMGEILVEIMRPGPDMPLDATGTFLGPYPSGAPAIFIDTVSRLGHQAGIIGSVGNDDFGRCCLSRLNKNGVDTRLVACADNGSTAVAFVAYDSAGERNFIFHIGNTPAAQARCLVHDNNPISSPPPAYFHVMGCSMMAAENLCEEIYKAANMFHNLGARISFDPNIRPELLGKRSLADLVAPIMAKCSVLLPGHAELLAISGASDMETAAAVLFENPNLEIIAVKLGHKGCRVFTRDQDISLGVYPITPVDPTGAGDCFDAAFLCGLVDGLPLHDTAKQASAAAALNTAAFGPMEGDISPESVKELQAKMRLTYP